MIEFEMLYQTKNEPKNDSENQNDRPIY
ncbi:protein of unknown function (plasmid) [Lactiplantibacillus plantarum]